MVARFMLRVFVVFVIITAFLIFLHVSCVFAQGFYPITFPVNGQCSFDNSFGAPRGINRIHEGIDIIAAKMTPVVAAVDGTIDWLNDGVETSTANGLPYFNLMLHGDDGNDYFYIHLNNDTPGTDDGKGGLQNAYAPGIADGVRVSAGQHIAYVGDSGNAEETVSHLHFEIHEGGYKNPINPYWSLVIAKNGSPFKDVDRNSWCLQYIIELVSKNIISGYSDSTFKPTSQVTKAEFVKMVVIAKNIKLATVYNGYFSDVTSSHWAWRFLEGAKAVNVITGDKDNNFKPDEPIKRVEAANIAVNACGLTLDNYSAENISSSVFKDVDKAFWGCSPIMAAQSAGIINGYSDGTFRPLNFISRAEATKIICKILTIKN